MSLSIPMAIAACAHHEAPRIDPAPTARLSVAQGADGVYRLCAVDDCPMPTPKVVALPARAIELPAITRPASPPPPREVEITVRFALASARLDPAAREAIGQAKTDLLSAQRIRILASTDAVGAKRFNKRLAAARAQAVRRHLLELGVSASRIETATACCIENPPRVNPQARRAEITIHLKTQ